jgi:hypothetical protein
MICTAYAFETGTKGTLHGHDAKEGIHTKMLELVLSDLQYLLIIP